MEYLKNVTKSFFGNLFLVINDLKIKLIIELPPLSLHLEEGDS
ncbi:hypothetical protein MC28_G324 (plasmid) [Bacillus thuringiensis MC28]|nr:hypothetical protein MC28_G324 [Bacillus thuringiensis MC28]